MWYLLFFLPQRWFRPLVGLLIGVVGWAVAGPLPWPAAVQAQTSADPITVAIAPSVPPTYANPFLRRLSHTALINGTNGPRRLIVLDQIKNANVQIKVTRLADNSIHLLERYYAVVAPFATAQDEIALAEIRARWQGQGAGEIFVTADAAGMLADQFGSFRRPAVSAGQLLTQLEANRQAVGILAFDQLDPRFKVLAVDGMNLLSNQLDPADYPLAVAISVDGKAERLVADLLQPLVEPTNRNKQQLTTLLMTGVTAMARGTAAAIERNNLTYPAEIISATLAAADITHVSNEIPFLADCVVNNSPNNLTMCSHNSYWAALAAIGTDVVGLSGNHVNDFGREGARRSLQFYREQKIAIYGSGLTIDEACAPLLWEHNGNTFAFIAALAFGPEFAWVTNTQPGACYYYEHKERLLGAIAQLAQKVDVVAVELQYEESYQAYPLPGQVREFRELRAAGADLVTGVQSHVPQALEPYGPDAVGGNGMIVYGLGNLFFDQMWSWETRTELYARHTVYQGRLINTEILTGVLEDFAQPRWATLAERTEILNRIFSAAPQRPEE